ncbi:MAG: transcription-repair coupling factor [Lentisphaerae bacterium]|nr:transcription-repair coupling factor [Lentisphaerota bacterium]
MLYRTADAGTSAVAAVDMSVAGALALSAINRALQRHRKVFIVLPQLDGAEEIYRQLTLWNKTLDLDWSVELLNEIQRGRFYIAGSESGRARVLAKLAHGQVDVLVTSLAALLAPAPEVQSLRSSEIILETGREYPFMQLLEALVKLDYDDEYEVANPGEFSRRGGIIDIFSPEADKPARIEFFGDEIDSIRYFDPATQRSLPGTVKSYRVINRCTIQTLTDENGTAFENTVPALEYFDPENMELLEFFPTQYSEFFQKFSDEDHRQLYDDFIARLPEKILRRFYSTSEAAKSDLLPGGIYPATAHLVDSLPEAAADRGRELLARQWSMQLRQWHECKYRIIVCSNDESGTKNLREYFEINDLADLPIEFAVMETPGGFFDFEHQCVLITENELFAGTQAAKRSLKHSTDETPADQELKLEHAVISDLEPGCHAVHAAHGIALYHGLKLESAPDGSQREVMILEYADNAMLQVPVHQAASVSCYIAGGRASSVKLHRLGGIKWSKDKQATTDAVHQYAAEMLRLQAVRAAAPGLEIPHNDLAIKEFIARFKFADTPDQQRSFEEIASDLDCGKPMDRLLCGDVGYGKTEIAMRAAFKMVDAGFQVAMIAPTTVLAQQHYMSFLERFTTYPYTIEVLSRFRSNAEQQSVISRIASGGVDIVIGTHRLASSDVQFKNLGLVIVDEEQRFGVKIKDRLLRMRSDVNVLTMSATPIPRTLYLSMAGARQLSTIMTAPVERLPVKTIVMREDDVAIAQAITEEVARGGQVYILHNRVRSIKDRCKKLAQLLPDVSFGIAHGQMPEEELESVMRNFIDRKLDVLICTTIIESGLDMPNANTIIIERADRFGLAELYQLRGRVGRWKRQAYAYLVIPDQCYITPDGRKRIAAIRRCSQLGSGMRLALRDLEIRGAGNLLGSEQSGHINTVGFELYCQLLKQEISLLKNDRIREWLPDVDVNIEFIRYACRGTDGVLAAGIPPEYIESEKHRLSIFRTLNHLCSEAEVKDYRMELADRFGKLPPEVENLLTLTLIRILAAQAKFTSITVLENKVLLRRGSLATYRSSDGKMPRLNGNTPPQARLLELLRTVKLAALESNISAN